jgi:hypothetical protein
MSADDIRQKFSSKPKQAPVLAFKPKVDHETVYEQEGKRRAQERRAQELAEQDQKAMPYHTTFSTTMDVFLRYNAKKTAMKMMKYKLTIPDVFVMGLETLESKTDDELREYMEGRKKG